MADKVRHRAPVDARIFDQLFRADPPLTLFDGNDRRTRNLLAVSYLLLRQSSRLSGFL
jgi:hypothetical protein